MKFTQSQKYKKNIFSFDMLGEGARTMDDANRYYEDYITSIHAVWLGNKAMGREPFKIDCFSK